MNKTPLFRRGCTVTTAIPFRPPATHRISPFQNIPLFFYSNYILPPAIQLTIPMLIDWSVSAGLLGNK